MKIAIATDGPMVAAHFGRCPEYTVVTIADGAVAARVTVPNPGHEPGFLPTYLAGLGVSWIIAGGMGPRAQSLFAERKIKTLTGVVGTVNEALESFLAGDLRGGPTLCDHGPGQGHAR